jgi:hypothetical protein
LNSVDAIGENKGSITIRTRNENNNLILEFEDSGIIDLIYSRYT